jgi:hypothetical protein
LFAKQDRISLNCIIFEGFQGKPPLNILWEEIIKINKKKLSETNKKNCHYTYFPKTARKNK